MGDDSMRDQPGWFLIDDRLKRLSDLGDQLEAFRVAVDFGTFRPELNAALVYSNGSQGGRPPFAPVMIVQDSCHSGGEQSLRRAHRVPDQRPPVVHAFSWAFLRARRI